ncbi:helix-turn-helix transcriptional regulator [Iamia sp. SCSIO 61187]|uniref:helix-turn-helix domain-containing protein n=1 Tax=Iamia sp. SCSIO 61187 TaxID=2722752 RepID=UPI001C62C6FD|nr:helix-turn-helix transcriptional regulator [Iamia sp. SCSIO 61187]QYG91316.1 helix-turn-helix transcriptional regulator [Iamia sp. SCSIO 61187]
MVTPIADEPVGVLIRRWRERRRRSQLEVALAAGSSSRHVSFIETGKATPSPAIIERLCDALEVPLRDRNAFHLAAGFAPRHRERPLRDLGAARDAIDLVLTGHLPNPASAVNVRWELLAANRTMQLVLGEISDHLRGPPLNVLRATMHPDGLGPRIRNYEQWRSHLVARIRRQLERTGADGLSQLLEEISGYPAPVEGQLHRSGSGEQDHDQDLVVPLVLASPNGDLRFGYALTVFGAPRDVTLDEIAIETFFPTDETTASFVRSL